MGEIHQYFENKKAMKVAEELTKMQQIETVNAFVYLGTMYAVDRQATENEPANKHLAGKPLKKYIGFDVRGNRVSVWSHDCEAAEDFTNDLKEEAPVKTVAAKPKARPAAKKSKKQK